MSPQESTQQVDTAALPRPSMRRLCGEIHTILWGSPQQDRAPTAHRNSSCPGAKPLLKSLLEESNVRRNLSMYAIASQAL